MPRLEAHKKVKDYETKLGYPPEVVYSIYLKAFEDVELAEKMKSYAELRKQKIGDL